MWLGALKYLRKPRSWRRLTHGCWHFAKMLPKKTIFNSIHSNDVDLPNSVDFLCLFYPDSFVCLPKVFLSSWFLPKFEFAICWLRFINSSSINVQFLFFFFSLFVVFIDSWLRGLKLFFFGDLPLILYRSYKSVV